MIPLVTASEAGTAQSENPRRQAWELWSRGVYASVALRNNSLLRQRAVEGNSPVTDTG